MPENDNRSGSLLLSPAEVARELRISRTRCYELFSSGELPSLLIGRSRRVRRSDLVAFVDRLTEGAA